MNPLNKITLLIIAAISLNSCSNKKSENNWTKDNLKGNVQSYKEFSTLLNTEKGKKENKRTLNSQVKYNDKGYKTEVDVYMFNMKETYAYDAKEQLVEQGSYNASENKKVTKSTFKYDDKGNKIEQDEYAPDGSPNGKKIYTYDTKGNLIEAKSYNKGGSFEGKDTYTHDAKGNILERITYSEKDSVVFKWGNTYNDKGAKTETDFYAKLGGKPSETKNTYKYDDKGNKIEVNQYKSDGSIENKESHKFVYDEKGNWTKDSVSENGHPELIMEREYTYF